MMIYACMSDFKKCFISPTLSDLILCVQYWTVQTTSHLTTVSIIPGDYGICAEWQEYAICYSCYLANMNHRSAGNPSQQPKQYRHSQEWVIWWKAVLFTHPGVVQTHTALSKKGVCIIFFHICVKKRLKLNSYR